MKIISHILKIAIRVLLACLAVDFALIIFNSIMGVHVSLYYYIAPSLLSSVPIIVGLVMYNAQKIFSKRSVLRNRVHNRINSSEDILYERTSKRKVS